MKILELLNKASNLLKQNNIENPIKISRILLADLLNVKKEYLILNEGKIVEETIVDKYLQNIEKIYNNYPLQYITGKQEFMGNIFEVNENVLIPRADTEILVEEALKIINENDEILELCTGSGIIPICIAIKKQNIRIYATDISLSALELAKKNAETNNVLNKINFTQSNMFENIDGKYDVIISNPPYIETEIICALDEQVKKEPTIALDGGKDGLDFYRIIAKQAIKFLKPDGFLCLEIGYNQKQKVINLLNDKYKNIKCIKDLSSNDRVIICQLAK